MVSPDERGGNRVQRYSNATREPTFIIRDGNARTIAFYERRKDTANPFAYRVFLVEMGLGELVSIN